MKRFLRIVTTSILLIMLVCSPVLALTWEYRFPVTAQDTSGSIRTQYPALMGYTGQRFVDSGKIAANGLDTNMQTGATDLKYMMSTTNVVSIFPTLPADGQVTADFYTGYAPLQTGFPLAVGENGYIYTPDGLTEPAANDFETEIDGMISPDLTSGGRQIYKEGALGAISIGADGFAGMTLFEDPQDIVPSAFAAWTTVDLHEYIPSNASGVVLRMENQNAAVRIAGVRHGDSTDVRTGDLDKMCWTMVGVNATQEIDVYLQDATVKLWLVGFTADNFVFKTNADDISIPAAGWTAIDLAALAPNAVGVIVEIDNTVAGADLFGLRKNTSTDNRTFSVIASGISWAVIGCDGAQVIEGSVGAATTDFYLLGYITQDATFFTDAYDKSIGAGIWTAIDCSVEAPNADYLVFEVINLGAGTTYGFRKNGSAENVVQDCTDHQWAVVECDEAQIVEGWVANVATDFFLVGYITKGIFEPADAMASDTGFTEADQVVTLTKDDLIIAPGYTIHMANGDVNTIVDCGNVGNGAKFAVSIWFQTDTAMSAGVGSTKHIFSKNQGGNDYIRIWLDSGDGFVHWKHIIGGIDQFDITAASPEGTGTWNADTWYHVFASLGQTILGGAATDGARLRANNGVAATDLNGVALNNGANLFYGSRIAADGNNVDGNIGNVSWFNDDVTAAEELLLYQNVALGDEQGLWYTDEGRGLVAIDYGAVPSNGTIGVGCTWETHEDRPSKLVLAVDGTNERGYARPVTVTNNGRRWEWMDETSVPYADYITYDTVGAEVMRYEPVTMLTAETVNDETGIFDGTIVWGQNTNLMLIAGEMVSFESTASETGITGGFELAESLLPSTWFATGENLPNLPLYDSINAVSTDSGIPTQTIYFWFILAFAIGVFVLLIMFAKSALAGLVGMIIVLFVGSSMTIVPMWIPFIILIVCVGVMFLYRQVTY